MSRGRGRRLRKNDRTPEEERDEGREGEQREAEGGREGDSG